MFSRIEQLIGKSQLNKIKNSTVVIFGLGGVGSYVAEALVRSGVGNIILVDADKITVSNINRQLPALTSTLNMYKTEVVKKRLLDINPNCNVGIITKFYNPGDFFDFIPMNTNCIVDAIDSFSSKLDLVVNAYKNNIKIFSAMGTGKKLDPEKLTIADISHTHTCPLAKKLRSHLKKDGIIKGVTVVFSKEQPLTPSQSETGSIASMVFVPATAGLLLAKATITYLLEQDN